MDPHSSAFTIPYLNCFESERYDKIPFCQKKTNPNGTYFTGRVEFRAIRDILTVFWEKLNKW